jgi:opacity protein-like surface antigen
LNHRLFIDASATPKVLPIDEEGLTEVGQDGTEEQTPPCPETSSHLELKDIIMDSKLLFAATIAVSVLSTLALADEANAATRTLTRAEVQAEVAQAMANGTLQRSDYDYGATTSATVSTQTRAQVDSELAAAQASRRSLVGPDANRTYNPYGTAILQASNVTRAQVKADVLQAAADGTLRRTDYDYGALVARPAHVHAPSRFAQRIKAALARLEG